MGFCWAGGCVSNEDDTRCCIDCSLADVCAEVCSESNEVIASCREKDWKPGKEHCEEWDKEDERHPIRGNFEKFKKKQEGVGKDGEVPEV